MPTRRSLKTRPRRFGVVGVIMTPANLRFALRMSAPPDLFEIRLDHLIKHLAEIEDTIRKLRAPIIITARHPLEGGAGKLAAPQRAALLFQFLDHASYVDIELRALHELRSIHRQARAKKIGVIVSFHDLKRTPSLSRLRAKARAAIAAGADVIKVATRTDNYAQVQRLLNFFDEQHVDIAVSAMGIGNLGAKSRLALMRRGSVLNYAYLGRASFPGQPSLRAIQRWTLSAHHAVTLRKRVGPIRLALRADR
jgi:3-dehydroquinate dehydratase-1